MYEKIIICLENFKTLNKKWIKKIIYWWFKKF